MAIFFDDKYCKIAKTTNNFIDNTTEIEMNVYRSKETREREKTLKDVSLTFKSNAQNYLIENVKKLIDETNQIQDIDTIQDREKFLSDNPKIKEMNELQESIQKEGLYLIDNILKENIDYEALEYKEIWKQLGLTKELCQKIEFLGTMSIGFDGIKENNLSSLYDTTKEKIVSQVIDC